MFQIHILALIYVIGVFNLFAVTEPGSEGPKSALCEGALVEDRFYRFLERAVEMKLLGPAELERIAQSETPLHPLAGQTKRPESMALFRGFEKELTTMDGARWQKVRTLVPHLVHSTQGNQTIQADAQKNTELILNPKLLFSQEIKTVSLKGVRWLPDGEKVRLVVATNDSNKVMRETPELDLVKVTALHADGVASAETDLVWSRWNNRLLNLRNLEESQPFRYEDCGLLQMGKPGNFLLRHKENKLYLRPQGRSRWTYWERKIPLSSNSLTSVHAIGGKEDGYFFVSGAHGIRQKIYRFDGQTVIPLGNIEWGFFALMMSWPEMIRSEDGRLFIFVQAQDRERHLRRDDTTFGLLLEVNGDQILPPIDLGADVKSFRFWRDPEGRLAAVNSDPNGLHLRYLDGGRESLHVPVPSAVIAGAFRFRGGVAVAVYRDRKIQIVDMPTGIRIAEIPLDVKDADQKSFATHQTADGQVYLGVVPDNDILEVYKLISKPGI